MQIRVDNVLVVTKDKRLKFSFIQHKKNYSTLMGLCALFFVSFSLACSGKAAPNQSPQAVVQELVRASEKGDSATVQRLLNLKARAISLYPELYRAATDEERRLFHDFLCEGLMKDLASFATELEGKPWHQWVEHHPDGMVRVRWERSSDRGWGGRWFDLKRQGARLLVVQTHRRVYNKIVEPGRWIQGIKDLATKESNGAPRLTDIIRVAPEYHKRHRARVIKVPDHFPQRPRNAPR